MARLVLHGIVGARPNMMKMAPLRRAMDEDGTFELKLVHTGQHYDDRMSGVFFRELGLPEPAFHLSVGSGSQGYQTARILEAYEGILLSDERPRGVVVVGDVTSTMACTLAAVKVGVPVAHVEAGLRSGDRSMPEEINRIVTDSIAEVLLVSEPAGLVHLAREGQPSERIRFVGNVMMDTLFRELPAVEQSTVLRDLSLEPGGYVYVTLHRPANVDDPAVLARLVAVLTRLSADVPIVFAVHPRTRSRLDQAGITLPASERFRAIGPLGYRDNLRMIQCAKAVLSDSGGIQEEASALDTPCLTLRDTTERPVTVELGSSVLVGSSEEQIADAWGRLMSGDWKRSSPIPLWDGHASERIVRHLKQVWASG